MIILASLLLLEAYTNWEKSGATVDDSVLTDLTAQQVIERMQRDHYIMTMQDDDVSRLLGADDERHAIDILKARYKLAHNEVIQVIGAMLNTQLESH